MSWAVAPAPYAQAAPISPTCGMSTRKHVSAATATVTFKVGATSYVYNNLAIPAGGASLLLNMQSVATYPDANWTGGAAGRLPNGSLAAVTVVANQTIIGIANEAAINGQIQDNINYEAFNQ